MNGNGIAVDPREIEEWDRERELRLADDAVRHAEMARRELQRRYGVEEKAAPRAKLRPLDVEHMLATSPPPVPWLAEPLLVRGCTTLLAGREGQGKSLLALALASAIGHGSDLAGMSVARPGRVLVIDAENGEREAWRRIHGLSVKAGTLTYYEAEGFSLRDDLSELEKVLMEHKPDLLVLDSMRSLWPAGDENDSGAVEEALGRLRNLVRRVGCACLMLHHAGKGGSEYRGSTAIGAAVEIGYTLIREPDDPEGRTRRRLRCFKCRVAPEPEDMWIELEALDGRVYVGTAEPFDGAGSQGEPATARDRLAKQFAEMIRAEGPMFLSSMARRAGREPDDSIVKRARGVAEHHGWIERIERGRYGPGPSLGQGDPTPDPTRFGQVEPLGAATDPTQPAEPRP